MRKAVLFSALSVAIAATGVVSGQLMAADSAPENTQDLKVATFAGGCFWCVESDFEKLPGVVEVISGYTGGQLANPTYKQVSSGSTRHVEAVQVYYDPKQISYQGLLASFWRQIDPTDDGGQFVDRGYQYSPHIFAHDSEQRQLAEASMAKLEASGRYRQPLAVGIKSLHSFFPAEDYHQDFYKKSPVRYKYYRYNSGRDQYLKKTWGEELALTPVLLKPGSEMKSGKSETNMGDTSASYSKPSDAELREQLSPMQYKVTQQDGTEPPFNNKYWDNKAAGIYVDIVSGEPLFSSTHKYKSGTGWPSFYQPLVASNIVEKADWKLLMKRTELRSKYGDSHLGHVFTDGPAPTGLRYCINSAALRFVPVEQLEAEGYGEFATLFE